jgi:hypothetical protein
VSDRIGRVGNEKGERKGDMLLIHCLTRACAGSSAGSRSDRMTRTQPPTAGKLTRHQETQPWSVDVSTTASGNGCRVGLFVGSLVRTARLRRPADRLAAGDGMKEVQKGRTLSPHHPVPAAPDRSGRATRVIRSADHIQQLDFAHTLLSRDKDDMDPVRFTVFHPE